MSSGLPAAALLEPVAFTAMAGWDLHDHTEALDVFRRSCREIQDQGTGFSKPVRFGGGRSSWLPACVEALRAADPRRFFEAWFRAYRVKDPERPEGLFTGYYEPEVVGSRTASPAFPVPVYRRPPDLLSFSDEIRARTGLTNGRMVNGQPVPYFTRREIEEGALAGQGLEVVYLADWADAFFMHIQGSGRVRLAEGGTMRLTFDAKSGHPYSGIGGLLVERGLISPDAMSMQAIRRWMVAHPKDAWALMWENASFIFFRDIEFEAPELGALGAQHVQLTPRRSLAIDRSIWMFGTPVWLDTAVPTGDEGGMTPFRHLLIAQDTGSAIKGLARGDVYWGFGEAAGRLAGPMKSAGTMTVLLPLAVARELGLPA
jgi:membrane-bound lytic murein transglycosylase A